MKDRSVKAANLGKVGVNMKRVVCQVVREVQLEVNRTSPGEEVGRGERTIARETVDGRLLRQRLLLDDVVGLARGRLVERRRRATVCSRRLEQLASSSSKYRAREGKVQKKWTHLRPSSSRQTRPLRG